MRWRGRITDYCTRITAALLLVAAPAAHGLSDLPYYDDFGYGDGTSLNGTNGWEIYSTGPGYGILPDAYHGWQGWPGGSATATNGEARVGGVALLRGFADYTGEPGTGWPSTTGEYDKAPVVTVRYEYEPEQDYVHEAEATVWSKFGNMFGTTRWHYENRNSYFKMMTVVRYFVKTNGLISAYDGHRIQHLTHTPLTNRTAFTVTADYTNHVWSLWAGNEQVVTNFALYKTHKNTTMVHDGWFKDYDGFKEFGFVDATTNAATALDAVRVFEGAPATRSVPFFDRFETTVLNGQTNVMSVGDLDGQNRWFATGANVSTDAQSTELGSSGTNGAVLSAGAECFQIFLDGQTNVWTDFWLKPLVSGLGNTAADVGGEDAVFWVDAAGDVFAQSGTVAHLVASVDAATWNRFSVQSDYGAQTWGLLVNGSLVASALDFHVTAPGNSFDELRFSVSGSAVAHLDDIGVTLESPYDLPSVSFETDMTAVGEGITNVDVSVTLSHASLQIIAVDYSLDAGGTASHAEDFASSDGTLVFSPGETNKLFSFTVINDTDNEEAETLSFSLGNLVNVLAGSHTGITVTIQSDPEDWYNIPFREPFEARAPGSLHGQHGWVSTNLGVQSGVTYEGTQAGRATTNSASLAHGFSNAAVSVMTELTLRVESGADTNVSVTLGGSDDAVFVVTSNGTLKAYNGGSDQTVATLLLDAWTPIRVHTDHGAGTWSMWVASTQVVDSFSFRSAGAESFLSFVAEGPLTIDDIRIEYGPPPAPTGVVANAFDARVDLDWEASQGVTEYLVQRSTSSGGPYLLVGATNGTFYADGTAANDTTYYYVVSPTNAIGEGAASAEAFATPRAAVLGLTASSGISRVALEWEAFAGATNFVVRRGTSSGGPYLSIAATNGLAFTDTNVLNETEYFYIVSALTAGYESTPADEVSATPSYRTIFYDSFEDPVLADRLESEVPGWVRYRPGDVPDTRSGLWNEDSTSMVTPFGEQAAWVWSERYLVTTGIQETVQGDATYFLSFNAAAEYGLGGIRYRVDLLGGTSVLDSVTAAWDLDTLDFTYRYETVEFTVPSNSPAIGEPLGVRLIFGSGAWQYVLGYDNVRLSIDLPPPPIAPNPMAFAAPPASLSATSIVMTAVTASNAVPPFLYYFENTNTGAQSGWIPGTTWTNLGLTPHVSYGYRVKVQDAYANESLWSGVETAFPDDLVAPDPDPVQLAAGWPLTSGAGEISMTAEPASDPSGPVEYLFENVSNGYDSGWSTDLSWTDSGLTPGERYGYRVRARDVSPNTNMTAWSAVTTVIQADAPSASTNSGASAYLWDTALLRGELTAGHYAEAYVCWGSTDPGVDSTSAWQNVVVLGAAFEGIPFTTTATGLAETNTYFYRCFVTNAIGGGWSTVGSLTTPEISNVMTNDSGGNNSWNVAGNWSNGHPPTGTESATIGVNLSASANSSSTPAYSGGLSLSPGAVLTINNNVADANALGAPITLYADASLHFGFGSVNPMVLPAITLAGDALINNGPNNPSHHKARDYNGAISGPGGLTMTGNNNLTVNLNASNSFASLSAEKPDSRSNWRIDAETPGALGAGDVTIGDTISLRVYANNAMADSATLRLNGGRDAQLSSSYAKLHADADDTVFALYLDGVQQRGGAYTSGSSLVDGNGSALISGSGTLTVLDSPVSITNTGADRVTSSSAELSGALSGHGAVFDVYVYRSTSNNMGAAAWRADSTATELLVGNFGGDVAVTGVVADLSPSTLYFYTMRASNAFKQTWAATNAAFTSAAPASDPTVTDNGGAIAIGVGTAALQGLLTAGSFGQAYICWGSADGGAVSTGAWEHVIGLGTVTESNPFFTPESGILYGVEYSYRVFVTNSAGSDWSDVTTFATLPPQESWAESLGWTYAPWTGDADSGVDSNYTYTAAHGFGNNHASVTINGVTFVEDFNSSGSGWSLGGTKGNWNGDDGALISGSSEDLAEEFVHNGNPRTVQLSGLSSDTRYLATFYSVGWENSGREQTFSSGGNALVLDQDIYGNNAGVRISYVFDASGPTQDFSITPSTSRTFHMYGLSNRDVASFAGVGLENDAAANITDAAADLEGILNATQSVFTVSAYWSMSNNVSAGTWLADSTASSALIGTYTNEGGLRLSEPIAGLTQLTTYYYTLVATNASTNIWAAPSSSFTTYAEQVAPEVDGLAATDIGATSAVLRASMSTGGVATAYMVWGETLPGSPADTGAWENVALVGAVTDGIVFSNVVRGLTPFTMHYSRAFLTNTEGGAWSALTNFTTEKLTATYAGPDGTWNRDYWNVAGNWNVGIVPVGTMNAEVPAGAYASSYNNASVPSYNGSLTIHSNATVEASFNTNSIRILGSPGLSTVVMHQNTCVRLRVGGSPEIPAIELRGDAMIQFGTSTTAPAAGQFPHGIHGPHRLTLQSNASATPTLLSSNSFSELIVKAIGGRGGNHWKLKADAPGALGTGNVSIVPHTDDKSPQLWIDAPDAMADTATLSLNGEGPAANGLDLLRMESDDTIYRLDIDGVQQPGGAYTSAETWLTGSGTLTVLDWPAEITNEAAVNVETNAADVVGTLNAPNETFGIHLYWSTNDNLGSAAWLADMNASTLDLGAYSNVSAVTGAVTALMPTTDYFYTMRASNAVEDIWATPNASFLTPGLAAPPMLSNGPGATNVGVVSATLNGVLTSGGIADVIAVWGTNAPAGLSTSVWDHAASLGTVFQDGDFATNLTGLAYGASYYYRLYASNTVGVTWSAITNFTTEGTPAVVALSPAHLASEVYPDADLVAAFERDVFLVNGGVITLSNVTDGATTVMTLPDSRVSVSASTLTIDPDVIMDRGDTYAVLIGGASIADAYGVRFAGMPDDSTWRFDVTSNPDWSLVSYWPLTSHTLGNIPNGTLIDDIIDDPRHPATNATSNAGGVWTNDPTRGVVLFSPEDHRLSAGQVGVVDGEPFTWSFWVKSTDTIVQGEFPNDNSSVNTVMGGDHNSGFKVMTTGIAGSGYSGSFDLADGAWHHVALRNTGGAAQVYTNGVLAVHNPSVATPPERTLQIGGKSHYGEDATAFMSDVAIWIEALTPSRIAHLASGGPVQYTTYTPPSGTLYIFR